MPALALVALFIVVPIAELAVIIQVGQVIGVLSTVGLLLLDSLLGSLLLRTQGRSVWRRFNEALGRGRIPHQEILDGVLVVFGGALLLTPGFLTDLLGLLLLLPPTRAIARRVLVRAAGRRVVVGVAGPGPSRRGPGPDDVEGSAREPRADDERPDGPAAVGDPPRLER